MSKRNKKLKSKASDDDQEMYQFIFQCLLEAIPARPEECAEEQIKKIQSLSTQLRDHLSSGLPFPKDIDFALLKKVSFVERLRLLVEGCRRVQLAENGSLLSKKKTNIFEE